MPRSRHHVTLLPLAHFFQVPPIAENLKKRGWGAIFQRSRLFSFLFPKRFDFQPSVASEHWTGSDVVFLLQTLFWLPTNVACILSLATFFNHTEIFSCAAAVCRWLFPSHSSFKKQNAARSSAVLRIPASCRWWWPFLAVLADGRYRAWARLTCTTPVVRRRSWRRRPRAGTPAIGPASDGSAPAREQPQVEFWFQERSAAGWTLRLAVGDASIRWTPISPPAAADWNQTPDR